MQRMFIAGLIGLSASAAHAFDDSGDSVSELKLLGLQLPKTIPVIVVDETLHISASKVLADYTFKNTGDTPVSSIVVLPLPDVEGPYVNLDAGDTSTGNFLQVVASQDGATVKPALQSRAYSADVDFTEKLVAAKVPLNPLSEGAIAAVKKLPQATIDEWVMLGLVVEDPSESSAGKKVYAPAWTLKSTLSWKVNFPPATEVKISTSHINSLGSSVAFGLAGDEDGSIKKALTDQYCLDDKAVAIAKGMPAEDQKYNASWSSYAISPGGWTPGIGTFKLIIEKGEEGGMAVTCGLDGTQTGQLTTEFTATNYTPDKDIDVLFLDPSDSP